MPHRRHTSRSLEERTEDELPSTTPYDGWRENRRSTNAGLYNRLVTEAEMQIKDLRPKNMESAGHSPLDARLGLRSMVFLLLIASLCYGLAELIPGRFAITDDEVYKAAGRNWAMTGKFAAPEAIGLLPTVPGLEEVYFSYPPLYTFLYGVYTKAVGFGPRRAMAYDALLHIALIWMLFLAARVMFHLPFAIAAIPALLSIPLGTVGRPDELAIILALGAGIMLNSWVRGWRLLCAGILLGLCAGTSFGVAAFLGLPVLLNACWINRDKVKFLDAFWLAGGAIFSFAACILPILVNHPDAYRQLTAHIGKQSPVLALMMGHGWAGEDYLYEWIYGFHFGYQYAVLSFGLLIFAALGIWLTRSRPSQINSHVLLAVVSLVALAVVLPAKYFYTWFAGAWLLVACVALAYDLHKRLDVRGRILVYACGICIWMVSAAPYLRMKAILWTLPPEQRLSVNVQKIRELIPPDVGVVTLEYWWALADRDRVYDPEFGSPDGKSVQYIVETGNGSGSPGVAIRPKNDYSSLSLKVIYNHLNTVPATALGFPISRSSYGFGPYILKAHS